jgi:hypothetical protein
VNGQQSLVGYFQKRSAQLASAYRPSCRRDLAMFVATRGTIKAANLGLNPPTHLGRQRLPDANELADGSELHLAHHAATVDLDGDLADAEIESDLLVQAAGRNFSPDLTFTRG